MRAFTINGMGSIIRVPAYGDGFAPTAHATILRKSCPIPSTTSIHWMKIIGFHHASLMVSDLERARHFYEGILGLVPSSRRPRMDFDGVWYEIGEQQIHLLALPSPEFGLPKPEHGGRDRHVALRVADLEAIKADLERAGISYTLSRSGRPALFCRDPDGNAFELIGA
jgi:glyoxylase I family protein